MAFETRCPECQAKLRLDEAPEADQPIECSNCGSLFLPPRKSARRDADDARPARRESAKGGATATRAAKSGGTATKAAPEPAKKKQRKAKKKRTNPIFLLAALAFGFGGLVVVFSLFVYFASNAGRVTTMLGYVPADANVIRGVNMSQLVKYPGYAKEIEKYNTSAVKAAGDELARAAGHNPDTFLDYLVIAKSRQSSGTATMYVMRSNKRMKLPALTAALTGTTPAQAGGAPAFHYGEGGPGILARATLFFPSDRIAVIVPDQAGSAQMITESSASKGKGKDGFAASLDATAKVCIRGGIWLLVRSTGGMSDYLDASVKPVEDDFKTFYAKAKDSKTLGVWTSPGGSGVRLGAGVEMTDKKAAKEMAKSFQEGPLGKGDESEAPNKMRAAVRFATDKRVFGEFMQYVEWRYEKECAYFISKVEHPDAVRRMLDIFNDPAMGSDRGNAAPGGGPGVPGPAAPQPGPPGGIATPGMGP